MKARVLIAPLLDSAQAISTSIKSRHENANVINNTNLVFS